MVKAFATGRVKLDKQGQVTVKGWVTRWAGPYAVGEPFQCLPQRTDYRLRRKDYYKQQGRGKVIDLDILELCVHLRPWTSPCTDCRRGR